MLREQLLILPSGNLTESRSWTLLPRQDSGIVIILLQLLSEAIRMLLGQQHNIKQTPQQTCLRLHYSKRKEGMEKRLLEQGEGERIGEKWLAGLQRQRKRERELRVECLPCRHILDVHYLIYSLLKQSAGKWKTGLSDSLAHTLLSIQPCTIFQRHEINETIMLVKCSNFLWEKVIKFYCYCYSYYGSSMNALVVPLM